MKINQRLLRAGLLTLLLASMLVLGYFLGATTSGSSAVAALAAAVNAMAPTPTAVVPVGDPIPLKSLDGLTSLNATVQIDANGMMNGQRTKGSLTATVTTTKDSTKIVVTGPLLGDIIAQVGGSAMSLFTPSQIEIYKVPEGTYVVVDGLFDVCVKPKAANATKDVEQLSPQNLMKMFTSKDVAQGTYTGTAVINGESTKRYVIDGPTFLSAAQNSKDANLRTFGDSIWSARDADLYVSQAGYPVAYQGSFSGEFKPINFQGDFDTQVVITGINQNVSIKLPASCKNPISQ
jgi:hypothetical protein